MARTTSSGAEDGQPHFRDRQFMDHQRISPAITTSPAGKLWGAIVKNGCARGEHFRRPYGRWAGPPWGCSIVFRAQLRERLA